MQYFPRGGEAQHQIRSDGPLLALLLVTALLIVSATPRDDDVSFFMLDGPSFQLDKTLACLDLDRRSGLFVDSEHPGAERPAKNLGALWIYHALRSHPRRVDDAEKGDVVYIPMEPNLEHQERNRYRSKKCGRQEDGSTDWGEHIKNQAKALVKHAAAHPDAKQRLVMSCVSWTCQEFFIDKAAKEFLDAAHSGHLAIHEQNPRWSGSWPPARRVIVPYVPHSALTDAFSQATREVG